MKKIFAFLLLAVPVLSSCQKSMNKVDFPAGIPMYATWEDILDHPVEMEWEVWNTGWINIPVKGVIDIKNHPVPMEDSKIKAPVPVTFVNHPIQGRILFDTGLDSSYAEDKNSHITGLLSNIILPEGEGYPSQSASFRLNDSPLSAVFFTHLHFDHTAGAFELNRVDQWIAGKGDVGGHRK